MKHDIPLSEPPRGFWARLHWETIGCWRDWAYMFAIVCILTTAVICWIAQYRFLRKMNDAADKILSTQVDE